MGCEILPKIPVLDFSKKDLEPGTISWLKTCNEVRQALEEYGCFIMKYNNFPSKLRGEVFDCLKDLFDLPTETKMKNRYEKPLSGYVGQILELPLHESMGIDDATSLQATENFANVMWPQGNDHFRYHFTSYFCFCLLFV